MTEPPTDPFGNMHALATSVHEYYTSFMQAGFTSDQAMEFAKQMMQITLSVMFGNAANG